MGEEVRRRVWVQNVAVQAEVLEARLAVLAARPDESVPEREHLVRGVRDLVAHARDAAFRDNPIPGRWSNWWRGTLIEAAYQNLHAAESLVVELYNEAEVDAEIPEAVARVETGLHRDDPRRAAALALLAQPPGGDLARKRARLRKTMEAGYAQSDQQHSRLRNFRNMVLGAATLILVFVSVFVVVVALHPQWVPLCFQPTDAKEVCPTGHPHETGGDVLVVALLGLLGGTLAGAVSIRKLSGASTPYDVPTALAFLKVPFGAMSAIGTLIVIRGDFVPGLSALDSQMQILAYALLFGYAQQVLTGYIDRQAQNIISAVPAKDAAAARPEVAQPAGSLVAS